MIVQTYFYVAVTYVINETIILVVIDRARVFYTIPWAEILTLDCCLFFDSRCCKYIDQLTFLQRKAFLFNNGNLKTHRFPRVLPAFDPLFRRPNPSLVPAHALGPPPSDNIPFTMREGFVGVHIGAGQHSEARTKLYLSICSAACQVGINVLRTGGSALDAACAATMVLEDAGETNAGYGSNLTESGTVEMDAGIMDGSSLLFGAVGAMPGIKNPILVAKMLVDEQQKGLLPLGRVPPGFLVGDGAREWAVRHGVPSVSTESLISEKASKLYRHYKKKLDALKHTVQTHITKRRRVDSASNGETSSGAHKRHKLHSLDDAVTDTVGVVVMDRSGNVASTVSSGGIALKQPGRVGQASVFGCGCWAQNCTNPYGFSIGISTTGCGEHLVRTFLARECAASLSTAAVPIHGLQNVMKEKFAESEFLSAVPEKLGGAICMHYDPESSRGEFLWTHTTASMGIAFQTTADDEATTKMSRLPTNTTQGTSILVEAVPFTTVSNGVVAKVEDSSDGDITMTPPHLASAEAKA